MITEENNAVNFADLAKSLWKGKWFVLAFTLIGLSLSSYFFSKEKGYFESWIRYDQFHPVNAFSDPKINVIFYSEKLFNEWQKSANNYSINFSDISDSHLIDGKKILKNNEILNVFFHLSNSRDDGPENFNRLVVRSNDLKKISAYYDYLLFLEKKIKEIFLGQLEVKSEILRQSKERSKENPDNHILLNNLDSEERAIGFLLHNYKKSDFLNIHSPTLPKLIRSNIKLKIIFVTCISLFIGVIIFLAKESILKNNNLRP